MKSFVANTLRVSPWLTFCLIIIACSTSSHAQVGINTVAPTAMLDVNGDLRIRNLPTSTKGTILVVDGEGYVASSKNYMLSDAGEAFASEDKTVTITGDDILDNIDLDLDISITVPANTEAKLIINYSVPMGTMLDEAPPQTYMGIRFEKDETEMPQGSRKFTLPYKELASGNNISRMGTISNVYIENFTPVNYDRTFVYGLKGYVEQYTDSSSDNFEYKFNMWQASGANYNWGKATLSYQLYTK